MPRRITAGTLITRAQQLATMENDDSIADAVWKWFLSMVYGELWPEVSMGAAERYFETSTTITADGSASYDEPDGHMATVRVVRVHDDDTETPLRQLRQNEEAAYKGQTGDAVAWTLVDDQLFLYPTPSSGTYVWYYQQQPTDLSEYADGDVVDVVVPAGEQFLVWGMVLLALAQQKQNVQLAMSEKEKARAQVQFQAANRNATATRSRGPAECDDDDVVYRPPTWERP